MTFCWVSCTICSFELGQILKGKNLLHGGRGGRGGGGNSLLLDLFKTEAKTILTVVSLQSVVLSPKSRNVSVKNEDSNLLKMHFDLPKLCSKEIVLHKYLHVDIKIQRTIKLFRWKVNYGNC